MPKNTQHQSMAAQIDSKGHASAPFHNEKMAYQASQALWPEDILKKLADEDSSIKLKAYQIHLAKGGSDLDNWLEAEQILKEPSI